MLITTKRYSTSGVVICRAKPQLPSLAHGLGHGVYRSEVRVRVKDGIPVLRHVVLPFEPRSQVPRGKRPVVLAIRHSRFAWPWVAPCEKMCNEGGFFSGTHTRGRKQGCRRNPATLSDKLTVVRTGVKRRTDCAPMNDHIGQGQSRYGILNVARS